ncbi:hypothetical protein LAD12857_19180 [Lacrimispora amygdalina]|uniref:Uncharacterized protein n=1 Tax=Lacrimispora amygdalina TaxID=253257 RepID=A0ABQ5M507_9FIRM
MIVYNYQCQGYNMPQRDNTGQRGGRQKVILPHTFNDSDLFRNRMPEAGRKGTKAALV